MKKSLIFVGLLAVGYANAQSTDPYEGKVGINTDEPSATLNVKTLSGTDNTSKNLELENSNGDKLLRVFNNGNIMVGKDDYTLFHSRANTVSGMIATRANWLMNNTQEGPYVMFNNASKTGSGATWTIFNQHTALGGGLAFNSYDENFVGRTGATVLRLKDDGKVGVGINFPSERLDINGNIRSRTLYTNNSIATTDKIVVVDNTGVLKSVDRSTITPTNTDVKATTSENTCTATNAGTFHYKEREVNGQQVGTMGFCTRQNGNYIWVYFSNGASILQSAGTNKFGEGL